jgi:hypothetical protein
VANIPVARSDGAVVGTVNLLDAEGHFTPKRVAAAEAVVAERGAALIDAMERAMATG